VERRGFGPLNDRPKNVSNDLLGSSAGSRRPVWPTTATTAAALVAATWATAVFTSAVAALTSAVALTMSAASIGAVSGAAMRGHFFVVYAMLYAALVGFVLGMGVFIWRGEFWSGLKRSMLVLFTFRRHKPAQLDADAPEQPESITLPYGFALATGTMLAWFVFLHRGWLLMPQQ